MGRFINPFTDAGFKILFGREASKSLLIDFLNTLLEGERCISDITYLNNEALPDRVTERGVIFDIFCISNTGEEFIVEMQNQPQVYTKDRFVFYMSRSINKQAEKGKKWKYRLRPVYGVFFLNFKVNNIGTLRTDIALMNMATGEPFSDKIRMIFLELPYFNKEEGECETDFERWLYLLTRMETLDRMPWLAKKAAFEKLLEVADLANLTPAERREYDASLDAYWNLANTLEYSEQKGFEEGKREGIQEEKIIIARNLKKQGIDTNIISQCSGLSLEDIDKL